jgi:hypothetical protein
MPSQATIKSIWPRRMNRRWRSSLPMACTATCACPSA